MEQLDTAYQLGLDYLYSFVDYSLTRNLRYTADKFNLDRIIELLDRLGNPHKQYPILHVAGTKGKGSIAALIASSLRAAGYRTGLYTSPHLQDYTERIQIDGLQIPRVDFVSLLDEMKPHVARIASLTTFELTTTLGFLYFARQQVGAAVIEVGLGGRLDATNVVDPVVSVISSLSYDHMAVLGNTLSAIATEKAGIIKPGRPVVLAPQKDEARQVVEQIALQRGSELTEVGRDIFFGAGQHSMDGQTFFIWQRDEQSRMDAYLENGGQTDWQPAFFSIPLLGFHQVENAATAYATLKVAHSAGLPIADEAIRAGFASVQWPGRFEILRSTPPVIVDSAHNRDSALKLRLTLDDYLPGRPVILVFGASEDKDINGMLTELLPRIRQIIATRSLHPRAMDPAQIVEQAHQFGCPAQVVENVEDALLLAIQKADGDAVVLVSGSLFVAAAARQTWFDLVARGLVEKG